jgi:UDP-N-acetylglucosamine pyrophosphorylase
LDATDVMFFQQSMMPVADSRGNVLLDDRHRLSLSPNGHGGSLAALHERGMLQDMADRGVDYISYFQVDNPLVAPLDPLFLGLHAIERSEMSSLTMGKASDDEKVGLFVLLDGRLTVVEYSSFPKELSTAKTSDGARKFDLSNIAVHVFDRAFVERLVGGQGGLSLPWHRAEKVVGYVDVKTGRRIVPKMPNAVKAEMFVFDALSQAKNPMLMQTIRSERFSPVKNAEGVDSVATAQRDMTRRAAGWLESCGVSIPRKADGEPDCVVEFSPLFAADLAELRQRDLNSVKIAAGERLLLE